MKLQWARNIQSGFFLMSMLGMVSCEDIQFVNSEEQQIDFSDILKFVDAGDKLSNDTITASALSSLSLGSLVNSVKSIESKSGYLVRYDLPSIISSSLLVRSVGPDLRLFSSVSGGLVRSVGTDSRLAYAALSSTDVSSTISKAVLLSKYYVRILPIDSKIVDVDLDKNLILDSRDFQALLDELQAKEVVAETRRIGDADGDGLNSELDCAYALAIFRGELENGQILQVTDLDYNQNGNIGFDDISAAQYGLFDPDGDGRVSTETDLRLVLDGFQGHDRSGEVLHLNADFNGDGIVGFDDISIIIYYMNH